jgi:hypothetical protein
MTSLPVDAQAPEERQSETSYRANQNQIQNLVLDRRKGGFLCRHFPPQVERTDSITHLTAMADKFTRTTGLRPCLLVVQKGLHALTRRRAG